MKDINFFTARESVTWYITRFYWHFRVISHDGRSKMGVGVRDRARYLDINLRACYRHLLQEAIVPAHVFLGIGA